MSLVRNPMHPERISPARAGVIALVLIFCACWLAFKGMPFRGAHEVHAVLASGSELHSRTPVRIAGVEVGKVKRVERRGSNAIVTMALEDDALPLHADATLKMRPRIFLEGNFFLDLRPGTPSAPVVPEGWTIPLSHTAIPVQLDQVLAGLQTSTRDNLRSLVRAYGQAMSRGGARALNRALRSSRRAFAGTAQAAEALRGEREGDLAGYVAAGGAAAEALSRSGRLAELVTGFNRTVRALNLHREALARSIPELDALLAEAGPALFALNRSFPPVRAFVRDVRPGLRAAPRTLRLALPLLDQVRGLVGPGELPALLAEIDPALRQLAVLEPRLEDLFALVTPVTECVRLNALPTLKKTVDDPPNDTGEPVYRELLYALVGLASASQNFDGNGPAVRYHAGFGEQMVTFGRAPSANEPLVGVTSERILGSRPRYEADPPPFRPDVPCASQTPPNLKAKTGPAPEQEPLP